MSFEPSLLVDKLAKLNESIDSIHTLSKWIQHHHRHAREIAALWADYTAKQAPITQYLALIYVANDVMQRTKKKSDGFSNEFSKHLPAVLPPVYAKLNSDLRAKVVRVVNILNERHCMPEKSYLQLRKSLESLAPLPHTSASSSSSSSSTPTSTTVTPTSGTPSFRAPTHPASALRPLVTATPTSPPPPPLASPTLDPIHNIARDIVACKDLVSPLLDAKSRAAMSPSAIRALITPEFLKKYKHAVSALEFVHQQQTVTVKFVEQVLAELDRPPSSAPTSASQSPAILKHPRTDASNGDLDTPEDTRQLKRARASPPIVPPPALVAPNGGTLPALDHFAFMASAMGPPHAPHAPHALASLPPTSMGAAATTSASASPVPDPMELLKKLTAGSTSGSPFSILGSAASPSRPRVPAPTSAAPATTYSPTASTASSAFDPMHFLSMSPPPPPGLPGLSGTGEYAAPMSMPMSMPTSMPLPPGLAPPPMSHLWAADGQGMPSAAGFVAVPTILGSAARAAVKGEAEAGKNR